VLIVAARESQLWLCDHAAAVTDNPFGRGSRRDNTKPYLSYMWRLAAGILGRPIGQHDLERRTMLICQITPVAPARSNAAATRRAITQAILQEPGEPFARQFSTQTRRAH
jgi:hypothetical protein